MDAKIIRKENMHGAIIGLLLFNNEIQCFTLEKPWVFNLPDISCIPAGHYTCQKIISPTFGKTFKILNVPDRTDCFFHWGNTVDDTEGCIITAEKVGWLSKKRAVLSSKAAFQRVIRSLWEKKNTFFYLNIVEEF